MIDPLNPLNPVNPSQQLSEGGKGKKNKKKEFIENKEGVFLPSRGLFYLGEYKDMDILNVRPLDFTDEDVLTTKSFYDNGTILNELLANVIIDENDFKSNSLVPIDRDTILIWLRSTAFGNDFEINYSCPKCGGGSGKSTETSKDPGIIKWDLKALEIPSYSDEIYEQLKEDGSITITTPVKDVKVKITVPSLSKTLAVEKSYSQKKIDQKTKKDFLATSALLSVVQGVEVGENKWAYGSMDIAAYFNKIHLPLADSRYILKKSGQLSLKYNTAQVFICKDCNHIQEGVEMPLLHKNFFWPESE